MRYLHITVELNGIETVKRMPFKELKVNDSDKITLLGYREQIEDYFKSLGYDSVKVKFIL